MSIAENIETIVATFQKGKALSNQELGLEELVSTLNRTEERYRSVAFEGASMGIALQNSITTWKQFSSLAHKHTTQIHIGLGWAIAEQELDVLSILSEIEPEIRVKVLDGIGYWFGLFRRRLTIRTQQIPAFITTKYKDGFDQGVGRAIWYVSKGEVSKLVNIINHFDEPRRSNLWQGIGVASTYVGGCSDELITELKSAAGEFKLNLKNGIEAAGTSMKQAKA